MGTRPCRMGGVEREKVMHMKYRVSVDRQVPFYVETGALAAVVKASEQVYLPFERKAGVTKALMKNGVAGWSYGFTAVTIEKV